MDEVVCKKYARSLQYFAHSEEYANVSVQGMGKNKTRINATLPDSLLEAIDGAVEAKRDAIAKLTGKRSDSSYSRSDLIQTAVEDYLDNSTTKGDNTMITLATRLNDETINNTYLFDSMREAIKPYIGIEQDSAAVPVMLMPHRISETELVWRTEVGLVAVSFM